MESKIIHGRLNDLPFQQIKRGEKTIELRLYDEKRQKIKVGDDIIFTNTVTGERMCATVKKLHLFDVKWVQDFRGNDFLLFNSEWHIRHTLDNNEGLELVEFGT